MQNGNSFFCRFMRWIIVFNMTTNNSLRTMLFTFLSSNSFCLQEKTNTKLFAQIKKRKYFANVPPYIICINGEKPHYFIQGDGWVIHREDQSNVIETFDLLFKLYTVLHLEYPVVLKNFFHFMESYIYMLTNHRPSGVVTSLHISLCNIILKYEADVEIIDDNQQPRIFQSFYLVLKLNSSF